MKAASPKTDRLSMNLTQHDQFNLQTIIRRRQIMITEAVRRALSLYAYVCTMPPGSRLMAVAADGHQRELVLL